MAGYLLLRGLHILGGGLGLASLAVPLLSKKGGRIHRRAGWIFVSGMTISSATGLVMTVLWLGWPEVFKPGESPEALQASAAFLGTLSLLTTAALWSGLRAFARKRSAAPQPSLIDVGLPLVLAVAGVATGALGLTRGRGLWVLFAAIEIGNAIADLRFVLRPLSSPRAWWYQHMRAMMIACITALTAFLVVAMGRTVGSWLPPSLAFVPWIAPSLIAVPSFAWWTRAMRRRLGEGG